MDDQCSEDEYCDYPLSFLECNCEHEADDHGWSECEIEDCPCEGHWEE
jgi:hypothetical protein